LRSGREIAADDRGSGGCGTLQKRTAVNVIAHDFSPLRFLAGVKAGTINQSPAWAPGRFGAAL
jgi:hypothetical protein